MNKTQKIATNMLVLGGSLVGLESILNADEWKTVTVTDSILGNIAKQIEHDVPLYSSGNAGLQKGDVIYLHEETGTMYVKRNGQSKEVSQYPTLSQNKDMILKLANINDEAFFVAGTYDDGKSKNDDGKSKSSGSKSKDQTDSKFALRHNVGLEGAYLQQNLQDDTIGIVRQRIDESGFLLRGEYNLQTSPIAKGIGLDGHLLFKMLSSKYINNSTINGEAAPGNGNQVGKRLNFDIEGKAGPSVNFGSVHMFGNDYTFHTVPLGYLMREQSSAQKNFLSDSNRKSVDKYQGIWARIDLVGKYVSDGKVLGLEYQLLWGEKGTPEGKGTFGLGNAHRFIVSMDTPEWKKIRTMLGLRYSYTGRDVKYGTDSGSEKHWEYNQKFRPTIKTRVSDNIDVYVAAEIDNWETKNTSIYGGATLRFGNRDPDLNKASQKQKRSKK